MKKWLILAGLLVIAAFVVFCPTKRKPASLQQSRSAPFSATILPAETLIPMGFMLTTQSPEGVKSGGTPVGIRTDFLGLPVDADNPSIGAIQWHEPTPDYTALVKKILMKRSHQLTQEQRDIMQMEIEELFLRVYGFPMSEAETREWRSSTVKKTGN